MKPFFNHSISEVWVQHSAIGQQEHTRVGWLPFRQRRLHLPCSICRVDSVRHNCLLLLLCSFLVLVLFTFLTIFSSTIRLRRSCEFEALGKKQAFCNNGTLIPVGCYAAPICALRTLFSFGCKDILPYVWSQFKQF